MEFQDAVVTVVLKNPKRGPIKDPPKSGHRRWKISFHKPSSSSPIVESKKLLETPDEFLCPVSGSLMSDPIIVSSGHSFERACVNACNTLNFVPAMADGTLPDFSTVISNLALKSAILNWCRRNSLDTPKPLDFFSAEKLIRAKMQSQQQPPPKPNSQIDQKNLILGVNDHNSSLSSPVTELTGRPAPIYSSSDESFGYSDSTPPLQLTTRPSCISSTSSSSEIDTLNPNPEEEEIVSKLNSPLVFEVEEALVSLRKQTRTEEESRIKLCTTRLLSALLPLITSRYTNVQVNAVASLVNLSLEKVNKVIIVRSGMVPPLVDVLKGGFAEAQEHACGAIFSLALDDNNKLAIGALGALPPLLHMLRSASERTRHDSALSLYHLSLAQTNRTKLVKLGSVPVLVGIVKSGHLRSPVLLILSNIAFSADGRAALLDSGGVECMVGLLRGGELDSESTRESCANVLYGLSHGGLRFKGLAKAAGAVEVLAKMEKEGSARTREKAKKLLEVMKRVEEEEEEEVDWEELLDRDQGVELGLKSVAERISSVLNRPSFE